MKRFASGIFICVIFAGFAFQAGAQQQEAAPAGQAECKYCGMNRHAFAHSAMLVEYEDGTAVPACSLHCAAVELAINIDKTPRKITVGDYGAKKQIDAETACWTLGGDVPGVMTKRAKWAFENKADCEKFSKEHGAAIVSFDEAIKASYEDMYADTKMIREKRKARRMQQKEQHEHHDHQHHQQQPEGTK